MNIHVCTKRGEYLVEVSATTDAGKGQPEGQLGSQQAVQPDSQLPAQRSCVCVRVCVVIV